MVENKKEQKDSCGVCLYSLLEERMVRGEKMNTVFCRRYPPTAGTFSLTQSKWICGEGRDQNGTKFTVE